MFALIRNDGIRKGTWVSFKSCNSFIAKRTKLLKLSRKLSSVLVISFRVPKIFGVKSESKPFSKCSQNLKWIRSQFSFVPIWYQGFQTSIRKHRSITFQSAMGNIFQSLCRLERELTIRTTIITLPIPNHSTRFLGKNFPCAIIYKRFQTIVIFGKLFVLQSPENDIFKSFRMTVIYRNSKFVTHILYGCPVHIILGLA